MSKYAIKKFLFGLAAAVAVAILSVAYFKNDSPANRYSLLSPNVGFVDKNDLLVNFQPLRESLTRKYEKLDDYLISIYFEYLPTGANISINKDEKIWPASLIKIPVAMAAMKKVQDGEWDMDKELTIFDEDKDNKFGDLYKKPAGTTMTIRELLRESLTHSDNTAHFVLLHNLNDYEVKNIYIHLGLDDLVGIIRHTPSEEEITDNRITAKRFSVFFRSLYNATYLLPEYSEMFLNILKNAPREYLNSGIPANILFVHKTGTRTDKAVWADAGIVFAPNRPYLLTVMIQNTNGNASATGEVEELFANISDEIYKYVSQSGK